jgi:hypothetical protein
MAMAYLPSARAVMLRALVHVWLLGSRDSCRPSQANCTTDPELTRERHPLLQLVDVHHLHERLLGLWRAWPYHPCSHLPRRAHRGVDRHDKWLRSHLLLPLARRHAARKWERLRYGPPLARSPAKSTLLRTIQSFFEMAHWMSMQQGVCLHTDAWTHTCSCARCVPRTHAHALLHMHKHMLL